MKIFKEYILPRFILDYSTFYPFLMIGGVIAARLSITSWEVWLGFIANYLMLVFAFLYNDIEDAEDDAKSTYKHLPFRKHIRLNLGTYEMEPGFRRFQNPFSNATLTRDQGVNILFIIFLTSMLISFLVAGFLGFFIALSNLIIGTLYSGGMIRFKKYFLIDVLSHAYLLAGVQILYFFAYRNAQLDILSWLLFIFTILFSIGGDLWNEYRDYDDDQQAGFKNTASYLGKKNTLIANKFLSFVSISVIIVLVVMIIYR